MTKTILALLLANIVFGAGYPFVRVVLESFTPMQWILMRALFAAPLLLFIGAKEMNLGQLKKVFWIFLAAIFGVVINQIFFVKGLAETTSAHASVLNATIPLQAAIFGWLFIKESMNLKKIFGILLGFAGVAYLLKVDQAGWTGPHFRGDLFILANAASYALYLVVVKKTLTNVPPLACHAWASLIGLGVLGFYGNWNFPLQTVSQASIPLWAAMIYLILGPTILSYVLTLWSLKKVSASDAALYIYVQPVTSAVVSFFMLGEVPDQRFYVSSLLVFVGIFVGRGK